MSGNHFDIKLLQAGRVQLPTHRHCTYACAGLQGNVIRKHAKIKFVFSQEPLHSKPTAVTCVPSELHHAQRKLRLATDKA